MCGITGLYAFNKEGSLQLSNIERSTSCLSHRGPDDLGIYRDEMVGLGHRRLSIIDTSSAGHQPMSSNDGRYQLVFNGEIYNYKELKRDLESKGIAFVSTSDTEVLLKLLIHEGKSAITKLNGFFSFAFYDKLKGYLLIARDRLGIKPLLYFQDHHSFLFASELTAILAYGLDLELDHSALHDFLRFNYVPAPNTMIKGVKKLRPGHLVEIDSGGVTIDKYYNLPLRHSIDASLSYEQAKQELVRKMQKSVQRRLIADVSLGCFLSGGIDSSVVTALAAQNTDHLATFSIGFKDNKFFDETHYAELVAKKYDTDHTVFSLSNDEIFSYLDQITEAFDEPFADSSAVPVYILSQQTRKHATVALSGDGADEIFSGYNKHAAWNKLDSNQGLSKLISLLGPMASIMPKSRSGKIGNVMRQILKFAEAKKMTRRERYWYLATFTSHDQVNQLLSHSQKDSFSDEVDRYFVGYKDLNDLLAADTQFVLPNDMLKKVDLMSMANGLEVRVPFLDHELVDYVFSLPAQFKLNGQMRKRILQDAFREMLPPELYSRPKKGFEMPVLDWLKGPLQQELAQSVFNRDRIESQGLFNWEEIDKLKRQLLSYSPGDSHARIWGLYVFQKWHGKYFT